MCRKNRNRGFEENNQVLKEREANLQAVSEADSGGGPAVSRRSDAELAVAIAAAKGGGLVFKAHTLLYH